MGRELRRKVVGVDFLVVVVVSCFFWCVYLWIEKQTKWK